MKWLSAWHKVSLYDVTVIYSNIVVSGICINRSTIVSIDQHVLIMQRNFARPIPLCETARGSRSKRWQRITRRRRWKQLPLLLLLSTRSPPAWWQQQGAIRRSVRACTYVWACECLCLYACVCIVFLLIGKCKKSRFWANPLRNSESVHNLRY